MPREFSEWEWDDNAPLQGMDAAEHAAMRRAVAQANRVREWARATPPVTVQRDWWRAVARPVEPMPDAGFEEVPVSPQPRWEIFAGYHTDRNEIPYPEDTWVGEFIACVDGIEPPNERVIATMVEDWIENCE